MYHWIVENWKWPISQRYQKYLVWHPTKYDDIESYELILNISRCLTILHRFQFNTLIELIKYNRWRGLHRADIIRNPPSFPIGDYKKKTDCVASRFNITHWYFQNSYWKYFISKSILIDNSINLVYKTFIYFEYNNTNFQFKIWIRNKKSIQTNPNSLRADYNTVNIRLMRPCATCE